LRTFDLRPPARSGVPTVTMVIARSVSHVSTILALRITILAYLLDTD
jgi:hypothetical protein